MQNIDAVGTGATVCGCPFAGHSPNPHSVQTLRPSGSVSQSCSAPVTGQSSGFLGHHAGGDEQRHLKWVVAGVGHLGVVGGEPGHIYDDVDVVDLRLAGFLEQQTEPLQSG